MTPASGNVAPPVAVGVVMPIHNEERHLPAALLAVTRALAMAPTGMSTSLALVLDTCRDSSHSLVSDWALTLRERRSNTDVLIVETDQTNVGAARRLGCEALLAAWVGVDATTIWIATTDADSQVPHDWVTKQLAARADGIDLWSGRISVQDWSGHRRQTARHWTSQYEAEAEPIHGASMGFNAAHYLAAGGFSPHRTGEDRSLYRAMVANGARVHHDGRTRVQTSARRDGRAPHGFSQALLTVEAATA
jgi:Glycosyl transferase family 2